MADEKDITTEEPGENLKNFSVWKEKCTKSLMVTCRNRYGNVAHFQNYDGVVLMGFGSKDGLEPDKDAFKVDKKDLPEIIEFLKSCL